MLQKIFFSHNISQYQRTNEKNKRQQVFFSTETLLKPPSNFKKHAFFPLNFKPSLIVVEKWDHPKNYHLAEDFLNLHIKCTPL